MVVEADVPRPLSIPPHEVVITGWPLVLGVARQHALNAHAYAFDILHGAPSLATQKIETNDAVGVDVRMHGDGAVRGFHEGDFGGFYETLVSRGNEYKRTLEGADL